MKPLISIIIPTYNRVHLIGETLDSILQQSYENWECIIVDDGGNDNTSDLVEEYIKKDNRFQYHYRPENMVKGPNSCRNYGFELSKGEWIKWFDSDDILKSNALEASSHFFLESHDLIVSSLEFIDYDKNKIEKEHFFLSKTIIEDYLVGKIKFYTITPTWKRSFLIKQDYLFDKSIRNMDDWDFNLRMLYQDPSIVYLNEKLMQYRFYENSLSHEINKLNFYEIQSEFIAIKKHIILLTQNNKADPRILKGFLKDRSKYIFRAALINNDNHKFYYLKELLVIEIKLLQFSEMIKTIIGFTIYSLFKKGYKLL